MGMKKKTEEKAGVVPPVPSIPATSVNPQPRNEASPVAPAKKAVQAVEQQKAGDDKLLTKQPLTREQSIERQAIIKSVLESPAVAQLIVGKNTTEAKALIKEVFDYSIELFYGKK